MDKKSAPFKDASIGRLKILEERHFKVARVDLEDLDAIYRHQWFCLGRVYAMNLPISS